MVVNNVEIRTVSMIGLGAIGILYAHQLSKRMPPEDLRIIADYGRICRYRRDGIFCNGTRCNFNYVPADEKGTPADLIMIAVKFNGLADAVDAIHNQVGPNTVILSLLNGISSEGLVSGVYGIDKVLPSIVSGMDAVRMENRLSYYTTGLLSFGDFEPGIVSEKVKAVGRFFTEVGVQHEIVSDMRKKQWSKFMLNAGANQATAVYLCNYAGIQKNGAYRDTMISAMKEVAVLAKNEHINLTQEDIEYWLQIVDGLNPLATTSMQQDAEAKRYSEVEMLGGTVLELGKKYGLMLPVNQMLYDKIKALESTY